MKTTTNDDGGDDEKRRQTTTNDDNRYLLLHSLSEIIAKCSVATDAAAGTLKPFVGQMLSVLSQHCDRCGMASCNCAVLFIRSDHDDALGLAARRRVCGIWLPSASESWL